MWVQITDFAIDGADDDAGVLAAVIASAAYRHDYASPLRASMRCGMTLRAAAEDPTNGARYQTRGGDPAFDGGG